MATGRKAFYTTPIKALSNQKYADLVRRHGARNVGLLTGDSSVNGEAPIVVMTTEVLRNMMYAGSPTLVGLGYVVMDEVHYLADRFRGAVWEEVIIHLPPEVRLISLSATVSNAEEFGAWLAEVRGDVSVVVSEHRPVPLWQHMMVGKGMYDLFVDEVFDPSNAPDGGVDALRNAAPTRVSPELLQAIANQSRRAYDNDRFPSPGDAGAVAVPAAGAGGRGMARSAGGAGGGGGRPGGGPTRAEVLERLEREALLPAITFIFSRVGCEAAVGQLLAQNVRLVPDEEGERIRRIVEERVSGIADEDLGVLGYWDFVDGLSRGYAAHHAGMLPTFREVVEELFTAGRIRAVFATETLALGINMPARTVVLERLVKFNGEAHVDVTPAEYTQLTGRAGRRGIDIEGHAVVLWNRQLDPLAVAGLASTRTYPLRSSFRPTYNMAVNLVAQFGRDRARELLETSFAQFQADRAVVGFVRTIRRNQEALAGYAEAMQCDRGDFAAYAAIRDEIGRVEKDAVKRRAASVRAEAAVSLEKLRVGDVIRIPAGRRAGYAVVVQANQRRPRRDAVAGGRHRGPAAAPADPRRRPDARSSRSPRSSCPRTSTPRARSRGATSPRPCGSPCPTTRRPARGRRRRAYRRVRRGSRSCAARCGRTRATRAPTASSTRAGPSAGGASRGRPRDCSARSTGGPTPWRGRSTGSATCWRRWTTSVRAAPRSRRAGEQLRRLYTEKDLLAAECLRHGVWDQLDAPGLAAAISTLVHEPRREESEISPRMPGEQVQRGVDRDGPALEPASRTANATAGCR